MALLRERGFDAALRASQAPVLGICLGMQLLSEGSDEGDVACLGVVPGRVVRMTPMPGARIPHMGWNTLRAPGDAEPLPEGIADGAPASFVPGCPATGRFDSVATATPRRPFCAP